ncbi:MAG: hypothetical protein BGO76_08995 [Caedibacter sp. 38-128]|nr:MAG: hypothetical protein BGO76_08995 [Caedibacter sp. 38-128]
MGIIDHRGAWCTSFNQMKNTSLQNSYTGFLRSFEQGRGIEFDVRDFKGDLVISHDIPEGKKLTLDELFQLYGQFKSKAGPLAINIKADGLQEKIKKALDLYDIENYFLFDMSIPETIKYSKQDLKFCIRHSEYEKDPKNFSPYLYEKAVGVWVDQFFLCPEKGTWITIEIIKQHLEYSKKVFIVSPELHTWGRDTIYKNVWKQYKSIFEYLSKYKYNLNNIYLCTDLPNDATVYFKSENTFV